MLKYAFDIDDFDRALQGSTVNVTIPRGVMTDQQKAEAVVGALAGDLTLTRSRFPWPFPDRLTLSREQQEAILQVSPSYGGEKRITGLYKDRHCGRPFVTVDYFNQPAHQAFTSRKIRRSFICSVCGESM